MKRRSIGTHYSMCVQPLFLVGTYNEDATPNFAPISWVSVTCERSDEYLLVVSMFGTKQTKKNIFRTNELSVNLVSTDMLEMVDFFGSSKAKQDNSIEYGCTLSEYVHAPTLDASKWVYEGEVIKTVQTGESDTFFCRIKNIQVDERIEVGGLFDIDLVPFDPVVYSGTYHSIHENLGKIGDFVKK